MYSAPVAIGVASSHGYAQGPEERHLYHYLMSMIGTSRRVVVEPIRVPTPSEEPTPRQPAEPPQPVARK
jgi:hypothetical protein